MGVAPGGNPSSFPPAASGGSVAPAALLSVATCPLLLVAVGGDDSELEPRIVACNDAATQLAGIEVGSALAPALAACVDADSVGLILDTLQDVVASASPSVTEALDLDTADLDDPLVWTVRIAPVSGGVLVGFESSRSLAQLEQAKQHAEASLAKARLSAAALRQELSMIAHAADVGRVEILLEQATVGLDDRAADLLGLPRTEYPVPLDAAFANVCHPDLDLLMETLDRAAGSPFASQVVVAVAVAGAAPSSVRLVARELEDGRLVAQLASVAVVSDAEQTIAGLAARFQVASDLAGIASYELDVNTNEVRLDPMSCRMLGRPPRISAFDLLESIHPDDRDRATDEHLTAVAEGRPYQTSMRVVDDEGRVRRVASYAGFVAGSSDVMVGLMHDVTEEQDLLDKLADSEARFRRLAENAPDLLYRIRLVPSVVAEYLSPAAEHLTGYGMEELLGNGMIFEQLLLPEDVEQLAAIRQFPCGPVPAMVLRWRHRDGRTIFCEHRAVLLPGDDGAPAVLEGIARDITAQREYEERLDFQSLHDPLTGLANRSLLLEHLGSAIRDIPRSRRPVAVLALDLDRFTLVNDRFGEEGGDEVLTAVADRLRQLVRSGDVVARTGGDEFVVVFDAVEPTWALARAEEIADRIGQPFTVPGGEAFCTASIGVAFAADRSADAPDVVRNALIAMHRAQTSRTRIEVFEREMRDHLARRASLEAELQHGIERNELVLHYQPEVDLTTGAILGVEALVRWQHPTRGFIGPGEFIPLAEETGLVVPLGTWVMRETCRQGALWREELGLDLVMRCNLSVLQVMRPDVVEVVAEALASSGLPAANLCLEITESALMQDAETAIAQLDRLKTLGLHLAIDDFGTGYSSLAYLKRLPVDVLKIDRSFTMGIVDDPDDRVIVAATVQLAHALGLEVTAEGIETANQATELRKLGCGRGQGYLYAPALTPDKLLAWVAAGAGQPPAAGG